MSRIRIGTFALIGCLLTIALVFGWDEKGEKIRQQLALRGIDPSREGIRNFLVELTSHEFDDRQVRRLIAQLDSPVYNERIDAQRRLICQSRIPIELLTQAVRSASAEKSYRADMVMKSWMPARQDLVQKSLLLIEAERYEGLLREIFGVVEMFADDAQIMRSAKSAIVATATPADQGFLTERLRDSRGLVVQLAMAGLVALQPTVGTQRLLEWSQDPSLDDVARLDAAESVADQKERRVLSVLLQLVLSKDSVVSRQSNLALRKLTGQKVFFNPGDDESRKAAVAQWTQWLDENGDSFEMNVPLDLVHIGRSRLKGHLLLATGYKNEVIEFDEQGNEVWKYQAPGVWSAEKLDNENVLIAAYQANKVLVVSPDKTVVWEYDLPGVLNARPLDNGNILAASHSGNRVVEIDLDKNLVWEYKAETQCHDAIRLENGNTLVCTNDAILEISPDGDVVWKFKADQAYGIDVLENGNLLIAQLSGKVVEVNRDTSAIIWNYAFASPVDVYRTDEGTTLITGSQSAVEIDTNNKVLWSKTNCQFGTARK